jgi:hypothetical protein
MKCPKCGSSVSICQTCKAQVEGEEFICTGVPRNEPETFIECNNEECRYRSSDQTEFDEGGKAMTLDYKELHKKYGGKFIAILKEEKVVASGRTFNETICKLQGMKLINKAGLSIRFIRPAPDDRRLRF